LQAGSDWIRPSRSRTAEVEVEVEVGVAVGVTVDVDVDVGWLDAVDMARHGADERGGVSGRGDGDGDGDGRFTAALGVESRAPRG
jgi:hypothetical protein